MVKQFIYVILFMSLISCRGYRAAKGRVKPVYFSADEKFFTDTIYSPSPITYPILHDLQGDGIQTLELIEEKTSKAYIQKPTFFGREIILLLFIPKKGFE